nr:Gfo/Idh/MocA family oxidoreductase [Gryllotalpicola sp.]
MPGPGNVASTFAEAVATGTASTHIAVGSRSIECTCAFAECHRIERVHGSDEDLVTDDHVDAFYVTSPHSLQREHAILALEAGKPMLVREDLHAQRRRGPGGDRLWPSSADCWSCYLPHYDVVRRPIDEA